MEEDTEKQLQIKSWEKMQINTTELTKHTLCTNASQKGRQYNSSFI